MIGVGGGDDGLMGMLQMQDVPGNSLAGWSFVGVCICQGCALLAYLPAVG